MSKRYGRNQKRAHREQVLRLNANLEVARMKEAQARAQLARARGDALTEFLVNHDLIRYSVDRISLELGRLLGKELEPYARQLMEQTRREHRVSFSLDKDYMARAG